MLLPCLYPSQQSLIARAEVNPGCWMLPVFFQSPISLLGPQAPLHDMVSQFLLSAFLNPPCSSGFLSQGFLHPLISQPSIPPAPPALLCPGSLWHVQIWECQCEGGILLPFLHCLDGMCPLHSGFGSHCTPWLLKLLPLGCALTSLIPALIQTESVHPPSPCR